MHHFSVPVFKKFPPHFSLEELFQEIQQIETDQGLILVELFADAAPGGGNVAVFKARVEEEAAPISFVPLKQAEGSPWKLTASLPEGTTLISTDGVIAQGQSTELLVFRNMGNLPNLVQGDDDPGVGTGYPLPQSCWSIFGEQSHELWGSVPWSRVSTRAYRLSGLTNSELHLFLSEDERELLGLLAVTDADIDTDGPGGSREVDPYWQPHTSLRHPDGRSCNSRTFPGVVINPGLRRTFGIQPGDFALLGFEGSHLASQVYDVGPASKTGEISLFAARELGTVPPDRSDSWAARYGNTTDQLVTMYLPCSGNRRALEKDQIFGATYAAWGNLTGQARDAANAPQGRLLTFEGQDDPPHPESEAPLIFTTQQWDARTVTPSNSSGEARGVIVHNTQSANRDPLSDPNAERQRAFQLARSIQRHHMDGNGWRDTGQHFTISRGGGILEGRTGTLNRVAEGRVITGAHAGSSTYNQHWYGIEIEGDFRFSYEVTPAQWDSLVRLIRWLSTQGGFPADEIKGHLEVRNTDCPGTLMDHLDELKAAVRDQSPVAAVNAAQVDGAPAQPGILATPAVDTAAIEAEVRQLSEEQIREMKAELWYREEPVDLTAASKEELVGEGDSWFDYTPTTFDILDCLKRFFPYRIRSKISSGGDTLENMVYGTEIRKNFSRRTPQIFETLEEIRSRRPRAFLFSGGGNDVAGDEFASFLNHKHSGHSVLREDFAKQVIFGSFKKAYQDLLGKVWAINPTLPILAHGYAHAIPDGRAVVNFPLGFKFIGPWLLPALMEKGVIDPAERRAIVRQLIDWLNEMLAQLDDENALFFHIDVRDLIQEADWVNELHLNSAAYARVAGQFHAKLQQVPKPQDTWH